jgi:hypothetical protein
MAVQLVVRARLARGLRHPPFLGGETGIVTETYE